MADTAIGRRLQTALDPLSGIKSVVAALLVKKLQEQDKVSIQDLHDVVEAAKDRVDMADPRMQGPPTPSNLPADVKYSEAVAEGMGDTIGHVKAGKGAKNAVQRKMNEIMEAERMKRAKKMGFDTKKTWFHGTKADVEAFDPNALGASTNAGSARQGFFFASDASTASDYADLAPGRAKLRGTIDDKTIGAEMDKVDALLSQKYGQKWVPPEAVENLKDRYTPEQIQEIFKLQGNRVVPDNEPLLQQYREISNRLRNTDVHVSPEQLGLQKEKLIRERAIESSHNTVEGWQGLIKQNQDSLAYWQKQLGDLERDPNLASTFRKSPGEMRKTIDKLQSRIAEDQARISPEGLKARQMRLSALDEQIAALDRKMVELKTGQNVIPVHLKYKNPYIHDFKGQSYRDVSYSELMAKAKAKGHDAVIFKNTYDPADPHNRVKQDIIAVFEPSQIRSKFAEFDPKKSGSGNISAGLGGAAVGGGYLFKVNQEQEQQRKAGAK